MALDDVIILLSGRGDRSKRQRELAYNLNDLRCAEGFVEEEAAVNQAISEKVKELEKELRSMMDRLKEISELLSDGGRSLSIEDVTSAYLANIDRYSVLLKKDQQLNKIIELIGHLDIQLNTKELKVRSMNTNEPYSIGRSNDVLHILPSETICLTSPTLKKLFFSRMMECGFLSYQLRGTGSERAPRRQGPVVALVDASGSMYGEPEYLVKAIMMILAKKMSEQHRRMKVILFSSKERISDIDLIDHRRMAKDLLELLSYGFEGNTDFNSALKMGLDAVKQAEWSGADVVLMTDGMSDLTDNALIDDWNNFKKRSNSRIFTLIVGNEADGGLEKVSDQVFIVKEPRSLGLGQGPAQMIRKNRLLIAHLDSKVCVHFYSIYKE